MLLRRDLEKETAVIDSESVNIDQTPLACFLSGDIDEERERLQLLETKLLEEKINRLKVSLSAFLPEE